MVGSDEAEISLLNNIGLAVPEICPIYYGKQLWYRFIQ
jgi:hypothetical protein